MDYEKMYNDLLGKIAKLSEIIPKMKSLAESDTETLDIVDGFVLNIVSSE